MFVILKPAVTMARFPVVYNHFSVLRFVAQRLPESAMIFVGVSQYDATEIGNEEAGGAQAGAQCVDRCLRLRSGVDDRDRIFGDQVDVNRTNVERCRKRSEERRVGTEGMLRRA